MQCSAILPNAMSAFLFYHVILLFVKGFLSNHPNLTRIYFGSTSFLDYLIHFSKQTFDLDTKQLTQQFRSLQSQLHPDKFSLKSEVNDNINKIIIKILYEFVIHS